jgi:hypothetical protein
MRYPQPTFLTGREKKFYFVYFFTQKKSITLYPKHPVIKKHSTQNRHVRSSASVFVAKQPKRNSDRIKASILIPDSEMKILTVDSRILAR